MRRILIVLAVLALGAAAAWRWWPSGGAEADASAEAAPERALPTFEAVAVHAQAQGLTLSGTVHDAKGAPISGAEVLLAASAQASVLTHTCGVCNEQIFACKARESAPEVVALLASGRGELVPGARTVSDEKGAFKFEGLAGVSFTVWARAAGFGDGVQERAAPGEAVELFLPAARTISGRLLDEQGAPTAGRVWAISTHLARYVTASAEANGDFVIQGLGEGPFVVVGDAPNRLPAVQQPVEAGGAPVTLRLMTPRRLEVAITKDGKPAEAMVRVSADHLDRKEPAKKGLAQVGGLYPDQVTVSATQGSFGTAAQVVTLSAPLTRVSLELEAGGSVLVTVLDGQGAPAASPVVTLLTPAGEALQRRQAATGELVVLGPVAPGDYQVRAESHAVPGAVVTVPVQVTAGEQPLELTLTAGVTISGRVLDVYGRPAPGVSVLVNPTGDAVKADREGRFVAPVPSAGQYSLHAHHSDWGGGQKTVTAPAKDVELSLEPKAGAKVTVSAQGRRVEGANVVMFIDREGSFRNDRTSGADGVVLMRGMPPGTYALVASHPDFLPADRQTVAIADGQLLEVTAELKPGASLTGQVVDTTGVPVSGAAVSVTPRGAEPVMTDGEGKFSLSPLRPKGTYAVRVTQRGLEQPERTLGVAGGEPVKVVVRRQPVFRGRVVSEGKPVRHFRIDDHQIESSDGRFELPLPATEDRVIFSVEAPGYEPLLVDRPRTPDLGDLVLRAAPKLSGTVKDAQGAPVADAVVGCDVCEQQVRSGPDGRYQLGKPAFVREFSVVAKKGRQVGTAPAAGLDRVDVVLKDGTKVSGAIYGADGRPMAGVELQGIHADRAEPVSVVTGADGRYAVEVPPGLYRFVAVAPGQRAMEPLAQIIAVGEQPVALDFGLAPGSAPVVVRVTPQRGYALWLVRGDVRGVGNPPMELLRSNWAQLAYQPTTERVTFPGVAPGRYTLVWASFHAETPSGPIVLPIDVPARAEITLVR